MLTAEQFAELREFAQQLEGLYEDSGTHYGVAWQRGDAIDWSQDCKALGRRGGGDERQGIVAAIDNGETSWPLLVALWGPNGDHHSAWVGGGQPRRIEVPGGALAATTRLSVRRKVEW